jgi:hypothetical protein
MEKTNKCGVSYPCWGGQATCKYWEYGFEVMAPHYFILCKWNVEGCCANPEAQKEAVSED